MARKFVSRTRVGRSDRIPIWFGFSVAATALGGNAKTLLSSFSAAALLTRPFTIIRTRGVIHVESDQTIASEKTVGAVGAVVVEEEASAAGIASLPGPISELDAPFIMYEPFVNSFLFLDATGLQTPAGTYWSFDSKAMRKVGISQDEVVVAELNVGAGAIITIMGRQLIKLH